MLAYLDPYDAPRRPDSAFLDDLAEDRHYERLDQDYAAADRAEDLWLRAREDMS